MEYDHIAAYLTLSQVALKSNTTTDQIIREIEDVISESYACALKTGNQQVLARWKAIPSTNQLPSAIELVAYLGEKARTAL